jgi:hypothetical protein
VSEQDVIDVLNILDPNKAVGPDIRISWNEARLKLIEKAVKY